MSLAKFLRQLFEEGRVMVRPGSPPEDDGDVDEVLRRYEMDWRREMAGAAPVFSLATASWAAAVFYEGCRAAVDREVKVEEVRRALRRPCPEPRTAACDYSADLVLRFLPDLVRLARPMAADGAVVEELMVLARDWPLSSVGLAGVGAVRVDSFVGDRSLRQLYADRIVAFGDVERLGDRRVDATVQEALGAFPELSPAVARQLGLQTGEGKEGNGQT